MTELSWVSWSEVVEMIHDRLGKSVNAETMLVNAIESGKVRWRCSRYPPNATSRWMADCWYSATEIHLATTIPTEPEITRISEPVALRDIEFSKESISCWLDQLPAASSLASQTKRKRKSNPVKTKLAQKAIEDIWGKAGPPDQIELPNGPFITRIRDWLKDDFKKRGVAYAENIIGDTQILRAGGRKN